MGSIVRKLVLSILNTSKYSAKNLKVSSRQKNINQRHLSHFVQIWGVDYEWYVWWKKLSPKHDIFIHSLSFYNCGSCGVEGNEMKLLLCYRFFSESHGVAVVLMKNKHARHFFGMLTLYFPTKGERIMNQKSLEVLTPYKDWMKKSLGKIKRQIRQKERIWRNLLLDSIIF